MKRKIVAVIVGAIVIALTSLGVYALRNRTSPTAEPTAVTTNTTSPEVSWQLKEGNVWAATGTPPACPEPPLFAAPVDLSVVTAVLYPGQPRGDAYKPHGGFRFDNQPDNHVTVKVPLDAQLVRGSRAFRNGENQYALEFIAPCGIWYFFGHLLELDPKFQAIADSLPLIGDFAKQQFFGVVPPVAVTTGEVIATAVGYAKDKNVFFDWGVLDLRHKNGFQIRPEWAAQFVQGFDEYAVCWLEMLPAEDTARLKALTGGDWQYGKQSDYCQ